jgi:tetratricopeptide (TPR) repeat protein
MLIKSVLVVVLLSCVAAPGRADEGDARAQALALLRDGNEKYLQGLYVEALDRFERASTLFPSPNLDFNIAQALNELGRPVDALTHYERYVHEVKEEESPDHWRTAHEQIFRLEGAVARVEIQTNIADAQVTIDGKPVGTTPLDAPVRLMPGPHAIVVARAGYEQTVIEHTLKAGETAVERIELHTEEEAAATRRAVEKAEAERRATEERLRRAEAEAEASRERTRQLWRTTGWITIGVGVASLAAGGVLGALGSAANAKVNQAEPGTPWASLRGDYERASSLRVGAIATLVAGGALTATGALLVVLTSPRAREGKVTFYPMLAPGTVGVVAERSF